MLEPKEEFYMKGSTPPKKEKVEIDIWQRAMDSIRFLEIHGFATETEGNKIRKRVEKDYTKEHPNWLEDSDG